MERTIIQLFDSFASEFINNIMNDHKKMKS